MDDDNLDVKLALEEMRFNMERSLDDSSSIDQKLYWLLATSGLLLTIGTTLQIFLSPTRSFLYCCSLLFIMYLFLIAGGILILGLSPQPYRLAISSEWDQLDKHIFGRSERDAIMSLLAGYVLQIQYNRDINYRKVLCFRFSLFIFIVIVILMMILAILH
jgi:hypothetical protein